MVGIAEGVLYLILAYVLVALVRALHFHFVVSKRVMKESILNVGEITLQELAKWNGMDPQRPLLLAVRGKVFDVSKGSSFYGPGKPYSVYAGKEISRALGKMSLEDKECNDDLEGLTAKEIETLQQWEEKFCNKYPIVGTVIHPMELTLEELSKYDGRDSSKPMLLSIRNTIFDVSKGSAFYGPDGAYPFAGRECAKALAKYSVELEDCVNIGEEDCSVRELDTLRTWEAQFHSKYRVVGYVKT